MTRDKKACNGKFYIGRTNFTSKNVVKQTAILLNSRRIKFVPLNKVLTQDAIEAAFVSLAWVRL